ncbi:hypothetical protein HLB23_00595 [Nocardia uniformis]|uniref:Uncharacterized protein n=1 Tax=Nocardia uniformis TaxID=53432 RepID=A0A849BW92_9NOCA|nr:hypothetical protein [Nocardia uniformis]NNH68395.1 hypothetical protein [Nocardia uniformis]
MAGVAAADTRWDDAAQLCAAREALLTRISAELAPLDPAGYRRLLESIDGALGAEAVTAARWAADQMPLAALVTTARDQAQA